MEFLLQVTFLNLILKSYIHENYMPRAWCHIQNIPKEMLANASVKRCFSVGAPAFHGRRYEQ